ncbi:glycoside hydrolase family 36 protein [Micromonospora sp. NPDC005161]
MNAGPAATLAHWGDGGVQLRLARWADGPVTARVISESIGAEGAPADQPLVEILAVGHGHAKGNLRNTATAIGARLRYTGHDWADEGRWRTVRVRQRDEAAGIEVLSTLRGEPGGSSLQAWTTVRNTSSVPLHLLAVSSLMLADPVGAAPLEEVATIEGASEWVGEWRWSTHDLRGQDGLPNLALASHQHQDARGARTVVGHGAWSSGQRVPAGVLVARRSGAALAWQIENNGPWRAELGERLSGDDREFVSLGLLGPTDADHGWLRTLQPGEEFESVPASVAWSTAGWQGAVQEMTRHRRAIRYPSRAAGAVVFNDYMNTLMGDPTTDKLLPLIRAASRVGAHYFCIDAGWYDDGGDWWDSVGEWSPSHTRFPDGGLGRVLDAVRAEGMVPGLWLEPEVVGVRSRVAAQFPDEAFLQRRGVRIVEHDRYLLDLRHEQARKHLDDVVDRLVDDFGVGYLKLDYNVTPGVGTDRDADSPGDGLLRHTRAYLGWLDGVRERHPGLVLENCASGSMRADYALLARTEIQSTSDQQEPLLYPPIAAGALMAVLPEQAGNWAYPQPSMTDEEIVFTIVTGLSGRLYLSGDLAAMSDRQLDLVAKGVQLAQQWDDELGGAVPLWPLGLPAWDDAWVAVGRSTATETRVAVWWRGGDGDPQIVLDLPAGDVQIIYPEATAGGLAVDSAHGRTSVRATAGYPAACVLRVGHDVVL